MEMDMSELQSFVNKFRSLWKSGLDAHLELHSRAGQAWVRLGVQLGHPPGPVQHPPHCPPPRKKARNGPSRQRRRERRAAARAAKAEAEQVEAEKVVSTDTAADEAVVVQSTELSADIEANGNVKSIENVDKPREGEEPAIAEQVEFTLGTAENATELGDEVSAGKVELEDEFCADDVYNCEANETKPVESETVGTRPKLNFDYYSLRYEDLSDSD